MKVFVLTYNYYDADVDVEVGEFLGVYSTREKAEFARGTLLHTEIEERDVL